MGLFCSGVEAYQREEDTRPQIRRPGYRAASLLLFIRAIAYRKKRKGKKILISSWRDGNFPSCLFSCPSFSGVRVRPCCDVFRRAWPITQETVRFHWLGWMIQRTLGLAVGPVFQPAFLAVPLSSSLPLLERHPHFLQRRRVAISAGCSFFPLLDGALSTGKFQGRKH